MIRRPSKSAAAAIFDGMIWARLYSVSAASMANFAKLWCSADTSPALLLRRRKWRLNGRPRWKSRVLRISFSMARMSLAEQELSVTNTKSPVISNRFSHIVTSQSIKSTRLPAFSQTCFDTIVCILPNLFQHDRLHSPKLVSKYSEIFMLYLIA